MTSDKDIKINFKTSADTKGAKDAEKTLKDVEKSQVKVNDATKRNTKDLEENKRALAEWQAQRNAERKGRAGGSRLATDPAAFAAAEEAAAKKVAAAEREQAEAARRAAQAKEQSRLASQRLKLENQRLAAATRRANAAKVAQRRVLNSSATALTAGARGMTALGASVRALVSPYALIGTVIGFATGAIVNWIRKSREAKEAQKEAAKGLSDAVKELEENSRLAAAAQDRLTLEAGNQRYADRAAAIELANTELQKELELKQQLAGLELQQTNAQGALAIAEIEASDLDPIGKLRMIAKVRDEMARKKRETDLAEIALAEEKIRLNLEAERIKVEEGAKVVRTAIDEEADAISAEETAKKDQIERDRLNKDIAEKEKQIKEIRERSQAVVIGVSRAGFSEDQVASLNSLAEERRKAQAEADELNARRDNLPKTSPEKLSQKVADTTAKAEAAIKARIESEEVLAEAQKRLADLINQQARTATLSQAQRRVIGVEETTRAGTSQIDLRQSEQEAEAETIKKRDAQLKAQLKQAEEEQKRKQAEAGQFIGGQSQNVVGVTPAANNLRGVAANIGSELQKGADSGELQALSAQFAAAVGASRAATVETIREMLAEQIKAQREIETLREQIKNNRD